MPRRRNARKVFMDMPEKATKLSLACKQFADEITNMRCLYILWFNSRCGKGGLGYIAESSNIPPPSRSILRAKSLWAPPKINTSVDISALHHLQRDVAHFASHYLIGYIARQCLKPE